MLETGKHKVMWIFGSRLEEGFDAKLFHGNVNSVVLEEAEKRFGNAGYLHE